MPCSAVIATFSNIPVCGNQWSATNVNDNPYQLEVTVTDGRARLALTFFNKVEYWERQLSPGRHGMFAGRVSTFAGKRQLAHPEFKLLGADEADKAAETVGAIAEGEN